MEDKGQVSYKLLCNACLCVGQTLNLIADLKLKQFYLESLNEIPQSNIIDMTPVLCWDCEALLRRAMLFKKQVKDSYQILLTYTSENLHECLVTELSRSPRLAIKANDTVSIPPQECTIPPDKHPITKSDPVKDEVKLDWESVEVTATPGFNQNLSDEKHQDDLKWKFKEDCKDIESDHADPDFDPEVMAEINTLLSKKKKKTKRKDKDRTSKSKRKVTEKKVKLKQTNRQDSKILTVELTYDEMMTERGRELAKEPYVNSEYKCETCILGFNYYKSYKNHMSVKHSKDIGEYTCPVCKTIHSTVESFTAHYKRHMRRYECSICQKRTMDLKVMQQHYYSTHEISLKVYKCDICGKVSKSIDTHRYHRESHKARLQCPECDKTFRHRAGLLNHRLAVHEFNNKFPCTICDKVFRWRTSLRRHQDTHENKGKPAAAAAYCALCGVSFSSVCSYQRHMNNSLKHITKDQLRFICDHCNVKFADKTKLRDHIEEKHLYKTFQCLICNKTSKNRVGLDQHIRNVHRGRPNNKMCHHCGKGFPTKVQLESHIRTHTGERPFICEYCPTTFSQQSNLYKHNRQVHLNMKSKRYPQKKNEDSTSADLGMNTSMNEPVSVVLHYSAEGYLTAEL